MRTATKRRERMMPRLRLVRGRKKVDAPETWVANPEYGMCRTLTGHAWKQPSGMQVVKDEVIVRLQCQHCGAGRRDHVSYRSGMVTGRHYEYPEGYQIKWGETRPAKSVLRRSYLHLLLEH